MKFDQPFALDFDALTGFCSQREIQTIQRRASALKGYFQDSEADPPE